MKKLSTALCLASTLIASAPVQAGWEGNWLVGVSGGYYDLEGELILTENLRGNIPGSIQTVLRRSVDDNGWLISVLGGYQINCCGWLLGAELNVDWYGHHHHDHGLAYTDASTGFDVPQAWDARFRYKREWVVGLTARLGYEISPCLLPYIRLGAEWSEDKLRYSAVSVPPAFSGTIEDREGSIRPLVGIGLEVPVPSFNCFTVRAEYDFHARGRRVDALGNIIGTGIATGVITTIDVSRKPYTQTGIVSVVWNI